MPATVILPCWRKPNFLEATLRLIEKARGANRLRYLFSIDRGADKEIDAVISRFKFLSLSTTIRRKHVYPGNSYNILESIKSVAGYGNPNEPIYLIEDDIFIAEDFFEFHEDAHKLEDVFFVSGCIGTFAGKVVEPKSKIDGMVYRNGMIYRSHGVSFKAHRLAELIEHATRDYYRDMIGYCAKRLPDGILPLTAVEQDGLTNRIMHRGGQWGLYPVVPRAFHAGCIGYNRGTHDPVAETLTADELLTSTASDHLNQLADPQYRDIARCELIRPRVSLRLV